MPRQLVVVLVAAFAVVAAGGCASPSVTPAQGAGAARSASPAPSLSPAPSGRPTPGGSPGPGVGSPKQSSGIDGQTVLVACPVDRGDPPCPAAAVAARFEVLDAGTQDVVATVDTDAHGEFTVAVPAGEYMLRAVLVGGAAARRPVGLAVSVTSGQYTRIVWRLDSGLR